MIKTLNINATIDIPPDHVLITRIEYEEMRESDQIGRWWTLDKVLDRTNRKRDWFKSNILDNPKYRRVIDVNNGGFVKYPKGGGDSYLFLATKTMQFLEDNFTNILKNQEVEKDKKEETKNGSN